jgi:hypothetical protein
MLAVLVLEEVENALGLHQPADEIEVRFVELHAVVARRMRSDQGLLQRGGQPQFVPHLRNDIGHGFLLENAGLLVAREQPHFRHHLQKIVGDEAFRVVDPLGDGLDDAVDVAFAGRQVDFQRDVEAQQRAEVQGRFIRPNRLDVKMEQLGDCLLAVHLDGK